MRLEIRNCPTHGFWSVNIQDEPDSNGCSGGQRVTPSKCCGTWQSVQSWKIDEGMIDDIRTLLKKAKRELKRKSK